MEIQQSLQPGRAKADLTFYKSFTELAKQKYFSVFLNFLKALQFAVLIPCSVLKFNASQELIYCMAFNLASSVIGISFSMVSLAFIYRSVTVFLNVADQLRHTIQEERTTDFTKMELCFSQRTYVADSNILVGEIDEQTMKIYDGVTKNAILSTLKFRYNWYRNWENLYSLANFSSMIFSIIVLSTVDMNAVTMANLIIYVVIVGLSQILMLIGCVILALSPLICIGLCIFCCCCKTNQAFGDSFINIPMKEATLADIVNAGGNCSICYQSINQKQKIYVLLCSDKHVFHCECLRHWAKVKNACPICRQEIPMTSSSIQPEGPEPLPNDNNPS